MNKVKRFVCIIIVISLTAAMIVPVSADDKSNKYLKYSLDTLSDADKIANKIIELGELDDPTESEARLCLTYAKTYFYIYYLGVAEMCASTGEDAFTEESPEDMTEFVDEMETLLDLGAASPKDIINWFCESFENLKK